MPQWLFYRLAYTAVNADLIAHVIKRMVQNQSHDLLEMASMKCSCTSGWYRWNWSQQETRQQKERKIEEALAGRHNSQLSSRSILRTELVLRTFYTRHGAVARSATRYVNDQEFNPLPENQNSEVGNEWQFIHQGKHAEGPQQYAEKWPQPKFFLFSICTLTLAILVQICLIVSWEPRKVI